MGETPLRERTRDEERLAMLFRAHYRDVAAYVRRRAEPDLVDDVVAETFLVVWRRLAEVPADPRLWLLGVARKTLATQRRSMARQRSLVTRLEETQGSVRESDPESNVGVADALRGLSETDREAITLVAWEGLTPSEAAVVVGQSPVAFRVRLHRAKRRLRDRLETQPTAQEGQHNLGTCEGDISLIGGGPKR